MARAIPRLPLLILLLAVLALTGIAAFFVAGPSRGASPLPADQLDIATASGSHRFTIELARDDATRARGLMFRTELAPDRGMLFDFERDRAVAMWMRNTYIPLDMIFIRSDGLVANIAHDAVPLSERTIESGAPVRFVLEVAAGTAKRIGAAPGDRVTHAWISR